MQICLVLVLVYEIFFGCFWSLQNILFLRIVPENILFLKIVLENKILCTDLFKNHNILQGLFFYKMGQSSCDICANHHKSGVRDQNQNEAGPKIFFLQGLKPKRRIFVGIKTIFQAILSYTFCFLLLSFHLYLPISNCS